ncbi:MAG TPA: twin-arginine translocase subunit TatC [Streptosporangiaceae bacterium]|nr:twin-arginine translocase subunit TatC [Streptosporangiaceae bacterium]
MAKLGDTVRGARVLSARIRDSNPDGRMPLMDHIRELRNRLVKICLALLIGTGIGLIPAVFHRVWNFIQHPFCAATINRMSGCHHIGDQLILQGVFDPFMLRVQVAFFFGLIITSPIWLYQLWAFVAPGLYRREKKWTYLFVGTAVPLFVAGGALAYVAMSRGLRYLLGLAPVHVLVLPSVSTYLGYFTAMLLGFGLAFELPLLLLMLNMVGILSHAFFRRWRRMMIFAVFVFAGIASPSPDPVTMLLLAVPCLVLVEISEIIIWFNDRRRAARPSLYEGLADDEVAPLDDDEPVDQHR